MWFLQELCCKRQTNRFCTSYVQVATEYVLELLLFREKESVLARAGAGMSSQWKYKWLVERQSTDIFLDEPVG